MEKGYFHESVGYWQTLGEPSAEVLSSYPEGTTEVPLRPSSSHNLVEGAWVEASPLTEAEVLAAKRPEMRLSFSQLLIGLVSIGWITEAEGELWLSGAALPVDVLTIINTLPPEQRFASKARALRMSEAERLDPLVTLLAVGQGKTPEEIDIFFDTFSRV